MKCEQKGVDNLGMYLPPEKIRWTIQELAIEFPKNIGTVKTIISSLQREIENIQKERGTYQFPKIRPYSDRVFVEKMFEEVFVEAPIRKRTKRISDLRKYLQMVRSRGIAKTWQITKEHISAARETPIHTLIEFNSSGFAKCLWHNEKSASLHYRKNVNRVHCFGCNKNADAIDVYMAIHGTLFLESVRAILHVTK